MIEDVDRIMGVMAGAFEPRYGEAWNRRQVEDALGLGSCRYRLLSAAGRPPEDGEAAVAFAMSRAGFEEEELLLLAVLPEHRGRGLGLALLEWLRDAASRRGARRLLLEMRRGNPAESLYRKFGFFNIGERRDYYRSRDGSLIDAITFACDIPVGK